MPDKVQIVPYMGYGNDKKIVCRGRIFEDEVLDLSSSISKLKAFINSLKRIESDELSNQQFEWLFDSGWQQVKTNSEGFYLLEHTHSVKQSDSLFASIQFKIAAGQLPKKYHQQGEVNAVGEILFPSDKAQFGIISDIDDTIMKTSVLSRFKWKAVYYTLFIVPHKRKTIAETNLWYKALHQDINPIFYISNSPWNLYDYMQDFLKHNQFPKGPIFLRDFGRQPKDALQSYKTHKQDEIERILQYYPNLPFILIGDGGERDADIYLEAKQKFGNQVKAIFIHRLGDIKHQSRIEKLAQQNRSFFYFIKDAKEGMEICSTLKMT